MSRLSPACLLFLPPLLPVLLSRGGLLSLLLPARSLLSVLLRLLLILLPGLL